SASEHGLVVRPSGVMVDARRARRPGTLSSRRRMTFARREWLCAVVRARRLPHGRYDRLRRQLPLFLAALEGVDRHIGKNAFVTLLLLGQQLRAACLRAFAEQHLSGASGGAEDQVAALRVDGDRLLVHEVSAAGGVENRAE